MKRCLALKKVEYNQQEKVKSQEDLSCEDLEFQSIRPRSFVKGVSSYSVEEKHVIVSCYLSGKVKMRALCSRFNVTKRTVYTWISNFASQKGSYKVRKVHIISPLNQSSMSKQDQKPKESPEEELARLRAENKQLQNALEMAEWSNHAKDVMIDLAEKTFNIPIRKKCGAKQ